jgi:hypothetical protein
VNSFPLSGSAKFSLPNIAENLKRHVGASAAVNEQGTC